MSLNPLLQKCLLSAACVSGALWFIFAIPFVYSFSFFGLLVMVYVEGIRSSKLIDPKGRGVLITGCDTGFGNALAIHLDELGFTVFAGCLKQDSEGAIRLKNLPSKRTTVVQMDVTNIDQIKKAHETVLENLPPKGLWGIVNNAGWSTFGEVEWVPLDTFRRITEINVFGIVAVLQTFLHLVRRTKGRVVTISSGISRMAVPSRGPYCLTKYAVEGLMDCLRYEMEPWGVHVSLIEPGNFLAGTSMYTSASIKRDAEAMWNSMPDNIKSDYGEDHFAERCNTMLKYCDKGEADLTPVIEAYTEGLMQESPRKRYNPMNVYFKVRLFIATHLPEWFYDNIYIDYLEVKDNKRD